ncbi:hypothetical protein HK104_010503, partial [Borealophlyctis nickersoniae]
MSTPVLTSPKHPPRRVYVNTTPPPHLVHDPHGKLVQIFPPNYIRTSKYSIVTFIPKNLFEQFRRIANLFFLALAILQGLPAYQTINPIVSALPLMIIVFLTALKDGFEDWRRHKSDESINNHVAWTAQGCAGWRNTNEVFFVDERGWVERFVKGIWRWMRGKGPGCGKAGGGKKGGVVHPHAAAAPLSPSDTITSASAEGNEGKDGGRESDEKEWTPTPWKHIHVGDLIYLRNNDAIPADTIILSTSEPDGLAYVETKNLDGETNLKIRRGVDETAFLISPSE